MNFKIIIAGVLAVAAVSGGVFYIVKNPNEITVGNVSDAEADIKSVPASSPVPSLSSLRGEKCAYGSTRPIAVMLPADPETRPLSGIGQADMVFEMPVTPNGVTRMMALYQCARPKEIGSVRSARDDFIPLASAFNAIYAHWGGEHGALDKLNKGLLDNIDAMKYEGSTYYRKRGIPMPHNGFTSYVLLESRAGNLNYSFADTFSGYPRSNGSDYKNNPKVATIDVPYQKSFRVQWTYQPQTGAYRRSRDGKAEIDKNTGKQVEVKNVVVMNTTSQPMTELYLIIKTTGSGTAKVYRNGVIVPGRWEKKGSGGKLTLYDNQGKEITLAAGETWFHFVTP